MMISIFGNGKLTNGLAQNLLENVSCPIMILTRTSYSSINTVSIVMNNDTKKSFDVTFKLPHESINTLTKRMSDKNIRVAYININDPFLADIINNSSIIFSCAREGLIDTYEKILNSLSLTQDLFIVSLDNDEKIYKTANDYNTNPHVFYIKGVAHAVITSTEAHGELLICQSHGRSSIFLPPECFNPMHEVLQSFPVIIKQSLLKICSSHEELKNIIELKRCDINAPHSSLAFLCLNKAINMNIPFKTALNLPLCKFIDTKEAINISRIMRLSCRQHYIHGAINEPYFAFDDFINYIVSEPSEHIKRGFPAYGATASKHWDDIDYIIAALQDEYSKNKVLINTITSAKDNILANMKA